MLYNCTNFGPSWATCRWYTNVHADGSILKTFNYLRENGLQGLINIWPKPTAIAGKLIICYALFEAALQLLLPGKRVEGPISPTGHRPVYKVFDSYSIHLYIVHLLFIVCVACLS